ncbi:GerAB/ArcD/ProY family transporter [Bacillus sp. 165]|uniref:GerAB/ArcD/ProY family transporter n=1 Tax=Bacillus sp. 165 TaxID=1529117 RepID=UPI0032AF4DF9
MIKYADFRNILPIWNHTVIEILNGVKGVSFSILGFEHILFYYPFIKNAQHSQKYAHYGAFFTTCLYIYVFLVTFAFFSEEQLSRNIWSYLSMIKIINFPFIERFEYILISFWAFIVLPNIVLTLWAASRGLKEMFQVKQKYPLLVMLLMVLCITPFLKDRNIINIMNDWNGKLGVYLIFCYLPVLLIIQTIQRKLRRSV